MKDTLKGFLLCIILPLFLILLVVNIILSSNNIKVWNGVEQHLDEFVLDYTLNPGYFDCYKFNLYDKDSTVICAVVLSGYANGYSYVTDCNYDIVASPANSFKSKQIYKKLIKKVPEKYINKRKDSPQKRVLNKKKEY